MGSMTLNLSQKEMEVLKSLATEKGLSKTALVRQALRVYQAIDKRLEKGERIYFEDDKKGRSELLLILG